MSESIGFIIKTARLNKEIPQKLLASKVKLSHAVICHMEKDRGTYSKRSLLKVCKYLDLDGEKLVEMKKHLKAAPVPQIQEKICEIIDEWYLKWNSRMIDNHNTHRLGIAKEELKNMICDPYDESKNNIFNEIHHTIK